MNLHSDLPSTTQFYEWSDPLAKKYLRFQGGADLTKQAFAISCSEYEPEQPIVLKGFMGNRLADVLWCTPNPLVCITDRLIQMMREAGLTGWSTYPVIVQDRQKRLLPGYFGFSVVSSAGDIDYEQSTLIHEPSPLGRGDGFDLYVGYTFDQKLWEGSDFFWVNGKRVVSERVRTLFRDQKIENVRFTPINEVRVIASVVAMTRRRQAAEKAAREADESSE